MNNTKFLIQMLCLNLLLAAIYLLWGHNVPYIAEYKFLYIGTSVMLSFIGVFSFFLIEKSTASDNIHAFTKVFLISTFVKMISTAVFLLVFIKRYPPDPDDNTFALPFLLIYLVFMIYEVYALSAIANRVKLSPEEDNFIDYAALEEAEAQAKAAEDKKSSNEDDDQGPTFEPPTISPFQK